MENLAGKKSIRTSIVLITIAFAIGISIISLYLFFEIKQKPECGNGKCEPNENCYNCPQDCKCEEGEYCSFEVKKCVKPKCGNGKCEPFESPENCCVDCKCTIPGEICDPETLRCKMKEINLSDERAIEILKNYLKSLKKEVEEIEVVGLFAGGKKLKVKLKGEEWYRWFLITEREEVIELPIP